MTPIATKTVRATKKVLIVDDETAIARMLKDALGLFRHDHAYTVRDRRGRDRRALAA